LSTNYFGLTWLPITPPTAAPPIAPTALPPVSTEPATAPTPAPLAVGAPVAALLPLVNTGPGEDSECAALLAQARVKPVAPKPGKTPRKSR